MPEPIIFARPVDVELALDPICPDWVIDGEPQVRSKRVAASPDGTSSVMVWSCTAGRFKWHYLVEETLHIISGEVFVTNERDEVCRLGPGDMAFFPAGSCSSWHVPDRVLKLAVCRQRMPRTFGYLLRAWNKVARKLSSYGVIFAEPKPQAPEAELEPGARSAAVKGERATAA